MKRIVIGCIALSALACGQSTEPSAGDEPVQVESHILGGTATYARPEVGMLFMPDGGGCTATLIDSRHFLTAAHCYGYKPFSTGGWFVVKTASAEYSYAVDRAFTQGGQLGADDLAVGRLTTAVPSSVASPATVSSTQPIPGWLTAIGYGCVARSAGDYGTKRYLEPYWTGGNTNTLCPGDSGGPQFQGQLADRGAIIRIASGSVTAIDGTPLWDIHADPVRFRSEILTLAQGMENTGVCYRAHVAGVGWQPTVCNGSRAGTIGQGRSIEAVQIWSARPGVSICYAAHVQNVGWQPWACNGQLAGTVRQGLRLEALQFFVTSGTGSLLAIQPYVANVGWMPEIPAMAPPAIGTVGITGHGVGIEALTVRLVN